MNKIYQGRSGKTYVINEPALASGGEGSVYEVQNSDNLVLKIFKEEKRNSLREEKLLKMVQYQLDTEQLKQITWPQDVVYNEMGFIGYVMPRLLENRNLNVVYSTQSNRLDLRHRMLIAYNLCAAVDTIHSLGQVCGDLNPQNICVNLNLESETALQVTLVDTDSYHITDGDKVYRCEVGLANYLAPEIQKKMANGQDLRRAALPTYTKDTDLFALAVHIFALLMNGCHPFACAKQTNNGYENTMEAMDDTEQESVVLPQPIENIRDGFFPFRQQRKGVTYPLYAPDFESLPIDIQTLFVRAFIDGYCDPTKRPSTEEWLEVLKKCQSPLRYEKCAQNHYYFNEKNVHCPYCEAHVRMMKMMSGQGTSVPHKDEINDVKQTQQSQSNNNTSFHAQQQTTNQQQQRVVNNTTNVSDAMNNLYESKENLKKLVGLKLLTTLQLILINIYLYLSYYGYLDTNDLFGMFLGPVVVVSCILLGIPLVSEVLKSKLRKNVYICADKRVLFADVINCILGGATVCYGAAFFEYTELNYAISSLWWELGFPISWCILFGIVFDIVAICKTVFDYRKLKELHKKNLCKTFTSRWKKTSELSIPQAVLLLFIAVIITAILVAIELN